MLITIIAFSLLAMHPIHFVVLINVLLAIWFYRLAVAESNTTGEDALSNTLGIVIVLIVGLLFNFVAAVIYLIRR